MDCRCPACDQVLLIDDVIDFDGFLCCDRCDRGFHPQDSRCTICSSINPFSHHDGLSFVCLACGTTQGDIAARMTA